MPRKIAAQVGSSVSRLLSVGSLKAPPAFYSALTLHPPSPNPQRSPINRPQFDSHLPNPTPPNLNPIFLKRKQNLYNAFNHNSSPSPSPSQEEQHQPVGSLTGRNPLNQAKRSRAQSPKLNPLPIVYQSDRIRRQFFRDHPWELSNPKNMVEMDRIIKPLKSSINAMELRDWGTNPGVEEVIACTIHLHENHSLSLSQAYHRTLSEYHVLRSEHETRNRFSVYEARSFGGYFNKSESERGFRLEEKSLEGWKEMKDERVRLERSLLDDPNASSNSSDKKVSSSPSSSLEEKNLNFTAGENYLENARKILRGFGLKESSKESSSENPNIKIQNKIENDENEKSNEIQVNHPSSPKEFKNQDSPALGPGSFSKVDSEERAAELSLDPSGEGVLKKEQMEKVGAGLVGELKR